MAVGLLLPSPPVHPIELTEDPAQRIERQQRQAEKPGGQHGQPPGKLFPDLTARHDRISLTRA